MSAKEFGEPSQKKNPRSASPNGYVSCAASGGDSRLGSGTNQNVRVNGQDV